MTSQLKMFLLTWNVGESNAPDNLVPLLGLNERELPDLFGISLQEVSGTRTSWSDKISSTLCHRGYEKLDVECEDHGKNHSEFYMKKEYSREAVFIETEKRLFQNEGQETLSTTMFVYASKIVFLNSLLSPLSNDYERKERHIEVVSRALHLDENHDGPTFWIGDLGCLITSATNEILDRPLRQHEFTRMAELDQLALARASGNGRLSTFDEMDLKFPPTAMLMVGSKNYDRREGMRWSDRILWKTFGEGRNVNIIPLKYSSVFDYQICQHRPVAATFIIKLQKDLSRLKVSIKRPASWFKGKAQRVEYFIPRRFPVQEKDYIALRKGILQMATVDSLPQRDNRDGPVECSITFEQPKLRTLSRGRYRLFYFSQVLQRDVGSCEEFKLLDHEAELE